MSQQPPPTAPEPTAASAESLAASALASAQHAVATLQQQAAPATTPPGASPLDLPSFSGPAPSTPPAGMDLLADVNLNVKIELGRTRMLVEDVLRLGDGSVVELDKLAGDPVEVYVNDRPIARGEVLVLNDNFCVRINEIISAGLPEKPGLARAR